MRKFRGSLAPYLMIAFVAVVFDRALSYGQVSVTTWHNDNWRTGQNTQEGTLTWNLVCSLPRE
jgi:hypothetical protein